MAENKIEVAFDKQGRIEIKNKETRELLRRTLERARGRSYLVIQRDQALLRRGDAPRPPPTNLNCGCFQGDPTSSAELVVELELEGDGEEE
jgi:hypothetical protein